MAEVTRPEETMSEVALAETQSTLRNGDDEDTTATGDEAQQQSEGNGPAKAEAEGLHADGATA